MQITAIETIQLDEFPNLFWVHVHTDEGLVGLGEASSVRTPRSRIFTSWRRRACWARIRSPSTGTRARCSIPTSASPAAAEMRGLSAIDIALWDIFRQATDQPIHQLLGGLSRPKIRVYNTCAGYRYVRQNVGQLTANWGLPAGQAEAPTRISMRSCTGPTSWRTACSSRASPA